MTDEVYKYVIEPRVKGEYDKEVKRITDKHGEKCPKPTHSDMEDGHRVEQTTSEKFRSKLIAIGLVKSLESVRANDIAEANERAKQLKLDQLKVMGEQIKEDKRQDNPNSRFIGEKGGFLSNDFSEWLYKESGHYFVRIRQTDELYYYKGGIYVPHGETYIEEIVQRKMSADVIVSSTHVTEIIRYIKRSVLKEIDIIQKRSERLACKNGVIDLRTKEIHKHSPNNYMFKMIPWDYVEGATCREYDLLVNKLLPDELERYKLYVMIGYPLINSYIYNKIFFMKGVAGSGKTTLSNIVQRIYGDDNVSNIGLHTLIQEPFMRVDLVNSYANFSGDASDQPIKDAAILKTLSGESRLSINVKNMRLPIRFTNVSKMIIDTNNMPEFNLRDDAMFRRIVQIDFKIPIKESEKTSNHIDKYLETSEMEGLLCKAVEAAHLILTYKNPFKSLSIAESKEAYENARFNLIDSFIDRHIQKYPNHTDEEYEIQADVWQAFNFYVDNMDDNPSQRPNVQDFYNSFREKTGIEPKNQHIPCDKTSKRCYHGIRLVYL